MIRRLLYSFLFIAFMFALGLASAMATPPTDCKPEEPGAIQMYHDNPNQNNYGDPLSAAVINNHGLKANADCCNKITVSSTPPSPTFPPTSNTVYRSEVPPFGPPGLPQEIGSTIQEQSWEYEFDQECGTSYCYQISYDRWQETAPGVWELVEQLGWIRFYVDCTNEGC